MRPRCQAHGGYFASGCSGCEEAPERRHEESLRSRLTKIHEELEREQAEAALLRSALMPFMALGDGLRSQKQPASAKRIASLSEKLTRACNGARASGVL
jgi:hypothetical protein